ncbi:MAG: solute carrier family 23 protein, partial [Eggerthellaceae bacterium]
MPAGPSLTACSISWPCSWPTGAIHRGRCGRIDDATTGLLVQRDARRHRTPIAVPGGGWAAASTVMGISFTFVTVLCGVAATYGYNAAAAPSSWAASSRACWAVRQILATHHFAHRGAGGDFDRFSLLNVGATSFGGGSGARFRLADQYRARPSRWCRAWRSDSPGQTKQLSVLFGLVVGYVAALVMGAVDLSGFADAKPLACRAHAVHAQFNLPLSCGTLIFLVSATETIGDTSALTRVGLNREVKEKELSGSIACDGFVSSLSACFGCLPITSFSQNVGLVAMTKVVNRKAIATGAVIMILAAFLPVI